MNQRRIAALRQELADIRHILTPRRWKRELETIRLLRERARMDQLMLKYGYNPNQPRVPAGDPDGGQWTDGGGGEGRRARDAEQPDRPENPDRREPREWWEGQGLLAQARTGTMNDGAVGPDNAMPVNDIGRRAREFVPEKGGYHEYGAGPNEVCTTEQACSTEEMRDFLRRMAIPGRPPDDPVESGKKYWVNDPRNGAPAGWVRTTISKDGLTIINRTLRGHVFYDGVIIRQAFRSENGAWYVYTYGMGNNRFPGFNRLNQWQGPKIFGYMDELLRDYIVQRKGRPGRKMVVRGRDVAAHRLAGTLPFPKRLTSCSQGE